MWLAAHERDRQRESQVKKSISIFCFRQETTVGATEDAVAVAGNYFISPVSKPLGDYTQQGRRNGPGRAYLSEYGNDGIAARRKAFFRLAVVFDKVDGIQIAGINSVTFEDAGREIAL